MNAYKVIVLQFQLEGILYTLGKKVSFSSEIGAELERRGLINKINNKVEGVEK